MRGGRGGFRGGLPGVDAAALQGPDALVGDAAQLVADALRRDHLDKEPVLEAPGGRRLPRRPGHQPAANGGPLELHHPGHRGGEVPPAQGGGGGVEAVEVAAADPLVPVPVAGEDRPKGGGAGRVEPLGAGMVVNKEQHRSRRCAEGLHQPGAVLPLVGELGRRDDPVPLQVERPGGVPEDLLEDLPADRGLPLVVVPLHQEHPRVSGQSLQRALEGLELGLQALVGEVAGEGPQVHGPLLGGELAEEVLEAGRVLRRGVPPDVGVRDLDDLERSRRGTLGRGPGAEKSGDQEEPQHQRGAGSTEGSKSPIRYWIPSRFFTSSISASAWATSALPYIAASGP